MEGRILEEEIVHAAHIIKQSDIMVVLFGAGMSQDSGIATYRGTKSQSSAFVWPPMENYNAIDFAKERMLKEQPVLTWSYWKARYEYIQSCKPHKGYDVLKEWTSERPHFVITSNIDGFWNTQGNLYEIHGSMHYAQCSDGNCPNTSLFDTSHFMRSLVLNSETHLINELNVPRCTICKNPFRLNVFCFGDNNFNNSLRLKQENEYKDFKKDAQGFNAVVVEIGAGKMVNTIRQETAVWVNERNAKVIRINLEDATFENIRVASTHIDNSDRKHASISELGALSALVAINGHL